MTDVSVDVVSGYELQIFVFFVFCEVNNRLATRYSPTQGLLVVGEDDHLGWRVFNCAH